jgi:nitrite reductase/ring-hydroxylating ferredoxin subunit/Fe-S cluster biogenesis protein NfuA
VTAPREQLDDLIAGIDSLEQIFAGWDETPRGAVDAYRRAIEALHGEALRRLIAGLKTEPAALAALKAVASDEVVYAVLRRHQILKPSIGERVAAALESVRPLLAAHGGDVELVRVEPPMIEVRFTGACDGCAASTLTFHQGVKRAVEEACPEITEIRQAAGAARASAGSHLISPFALGRKSGWLPAGQVADIPDGGLRALVLGGENVILARRGAAVSCFQNACAHMGLPLDRGLVDDGILTCPHHGFQYDLATGECLTAAAVQLQPHAVRLVADRVEVRLAP